MGADSGGGGGGGGDDKKDKTPTFSNLTEAAEAGYHGKAVNIEGKGLQKVEFADKSYDDKMANVSAGVTTTAAPKDTTTTTTTTTTAPKSHDSFGTSVSKFLGFEEKDDGFYLDQVITQFNTMGPEKALERANYLKQSGLMDDVSLVDQTLNSLNQGGTGVVYSPASTPISAPVQPEKTFDQAFAEARSAGQKTFMYKGSPYTTELAADPTVGGTVMPVGGPGTFTPGALPAAPLTPATEDDYLKASGAATATFPGSTVTDASIFQPSITVSDPQPLSDLTSQTVDQGNIFKPDPTVIDQNVPLLAPINEITDTPPFLGPTDAVDQNVASISPITNLSGSSPTYQSSQGSRLFSSKVWNPLVDGADYSKLKNYAKFGQDDPFEVGLYSESKVTPNSELVAQGLQHYADLARAIQFKDVPEGLEDLELADVNNIKKSINKRLGQYSRMAEQVGLDVPSNVATMPGSANLINYGQKSAIEQLNDQGLEEQRQNLSSVGSSIISGDNAFQVAGDPNLITPTLASINQIDDSVGEGPTPTLTQPTPEDNYLAASGAATATFPNFAPIDPDSQLLQEAPPNLETGEAKSFLGDSLLGKGFLDAASMLTAGGASLSNFAQEFANQPYISSLGMPTVRFTPEPDRDPSIQGPGAEFLQNLSDELAESAQEKFKSLSPETQEIARRPILPVDYTVGYGEGDVDPRLAMAAGLDPEGPPGFSIPDFLPFGDRRIDPAALAYSTVEATPATALPILATAVNPFLGPGLGFGIAGGDAARDVKNSLNEAFRAGDLQQTDQYKKTLDIINQLPDAADFSDEEKAAKALQAIKNDVDVTTAGPVGALGAFSAYLPFLKYPKIDKIASLFPKSSKILSSLGSNAFLRNLGFGVRGGAGESLTELGELELKDKLGVEMTGGLGDEYKTPTRQKEDEAVTAFALGFPFGMFGGRASSADVGAVGGTPDLTFQTGQAPNVQTTSREGTLGDLRSEQLNVTTPIVDLGTAGTFAQKPPTLASPIGADTVPTVDLGPASTQEVIIGTQLIENILDNVQTNADGAKSPSSKDIREIFSIAKQTNMPMSMVEQIIETRGAPELADPNVSPADLLKAQKEIANIIDTSPVDPVSGFKSPMGPQLEGIASLASGVNMDSSTLNKIVEQNKGAPYIVPTLSSLEAPVQQDTPLNLEGIASLQTIPGGVTGDVFYRGEDSGRSLEGFSADTSFINPIDGSVTFDRKGDGIYMTQSPTYANTFAGTNQGAPVVYKIRLKQGTKLFDYKNENDIKVAEEFYNKNKKRIDSFKQKGAPTFMEQVKQGDYNIFENPFGEVTPGSKPDNFQAYLQEQGYDGHKTGDASKGENFGNVKVYSEDSIVSAFDPSLLPGEETVSVEGKPRVRVTKDGPRVDLGTTTDATTTTDTVLEVPTDQNVVGATPDTNVTTDTTATVTTDTTPTVSTTVTIPETELDDTENDIDSADIEVTIDEETGEPEIEEVKSTPSGPIVLPETSTDPDTGETVYQCPDGYKLAKGKDGFQCFRTSSVTFMRAGIGTKAYTSVRPSRTRPGQKTVDVKKVETTEAVKA